MDDDDDGDGILDVDDADDDGDGILDVDEEDATPFDEEVFLRKWSKHLLTKFSV